MLLHVVKSSIVSRPLGIEPGVAWLERLTLMGHVVRSWGMGMGWAEGAPARQWEGCRGLLPIEQVPGYRHMAGEALRRRIGHASWVSWSHASPVLSRERSEHAREVTTTPCACHLWSIGHKPLFACHPWQDIMCSWRCHHRSAVGTVVVIIWSQSVQQPWAIGMMGGDDSYSARQLELLPSSEPGAASKMDATHTAGLVGVDCGQMGAGIARQAGGSRL